MTTKRSPKLIREIDKEKMLLMQQDSAQATEYLCTPYQWAKACKKEEKYDGSAAICTLRAKHRGLCIYTVPKSHTDEKYQEQLNQQKEKNMAKKIADEAKASNEKKVGGRRGNPEALAKAREAGAAVNEERRKRKIKLLVKENPKREGSEAHERFALYKSGMTVGEFLDAGGKSADLQYDTKHNYIEVK